MINGTLQREAAPEALPRLHQRMEVIRIGVGVGLDDVRDLWYWLRHRAGPPRRWYCSCSYVSPHGTSTPCPFDGTRGTVDGAWRIIASVSHNKESV